MSHHKSIKDLRISEVALEKAYTIGKSEKLAQVIHLICKKKIERVVITANGIPRGIATIKDIFTKLSTKRFKGLSPSSMPLSGFISDKFISGNPEDKVLTAAVMMRKEEISSLPIISKTQELLGFLCATTIITLLKDEGISKMCDSISLPPPVTNPEAKLAQALEKIRESTIRELVVLNDEKPIGIIGEREVALVLFNLLSSDTINHAGTTLEKLLVADVMKRFDKCVDFDSNISAAAELMIKSDVNILPVLRKNKITGVVTRDAILSALLS